MRKAAQVGRVLGSRLAVRLKTARLAMRHFVANGNYRNSAV